MDRRLGESRVAYTKADRLSSDFFRAYTHYMSEERGLAKPTINIRLRTLKCYLRWLYNNEYCSTNYALRIKLAKVVDDRVMPVPKGDIQKRCLVLWIPVVMQGFLAHILQLTPLVESRIWSY